MILLIKKMFHIISPSGISGNEALRCCGHPGLTSYSRGAGAAGGGGKRRGVVVVLEETFLFLFLLFRKWVGCGA